MNWPTVIVAALVAAVFLAILIRGVYNRKKGKHACPCGGSCGGCAMNGVCHPEK